MGKYLPLTIVLSYFTFYAINITAIDEDFEPYIFNLRNASGIYKDFIRRYNRTFKGYNDYYLRYVNFVNTLRTINMINKQSSVQQKVLPNKYADWSDDERRNLLLRTTKKNRIDPELKSYLNIDDRPMRPPHGQENRFELALPGTQTYQRITRQKKVGRSLGEGIGRYARRRHAG